MRRAEYNEIVRRTRARIVLVMETDEGYDVPSLVRGLRREFGAHVDPDALDSDVFWGTAVDYRLRGVS